VRPNCIMKRNRDSKVKELVILASATLALVAPPAHACTIFVLTDARHTLFCNNEDWPDPSAQIWFHPAQNGSYGAAYVGFDNGRPQGGLNTEGLAYDWVMNEVPRKWESDLPSPRGYSCLRMLETCKTVKDAIAFYRTYAEPSFSTASILVADKTGASVIIGFKDGHIEVEESKQSRGFGFGGRGRLASALADRASLVPPAEPTVEEGYTILYDCRQAGRYATNYSNIFDLKSGDIFLRVLRERTVEVKVNLAVELKKGEHFYEMA